MLDFPTPESPYKITLKVEKFLGILGSSSLLLSCNLVAIGSILGLYLLL